MSETISEKQYRKTRQYIVNNDAIIEPMCKLNYEQSRRVERSYKFKKFVRYIKYDAFRLECSSGYINDGTGKIAYVFRIPRLVIMCALKRNQSLAL